jgi:UDP:flavonoid glycosyltransferase YjiC (YdhE family)
MKSRHIAFYVEQLFGHIVPTLGIGLELLRRGHRVSYAVTERLAPMIRGIQATSVIIESSDVRDSAGPILKETDHKYWQLPDSELKTLFDEITRKRTSHSLKQLESSFLDDRPDVIVHDDILDRGGSEFALKYHIPKVRHYPQFVDADMLDGFSNDEVILVSAPRFFHRTSALFDADERFKCIGFIPEGRKQAFEPWTPLRSGRKQILISPTTGLFPQVDFCRMAIEASRNQPWDVVLSLSASMDIKSLVDPKRLSDIPRNVHVNRSSSNLDVMETSCLYVGQGGQGGTLEAIFCGAPQILIPPTPFHHVVARRVTELGMGLWMPLSDLSPERFVEYVAAALDDEVMLHRIATARDAMHHGQGAKLAADTIEEYASGQAS